MNPIMVLIAVVLIILGTFIATKTKKPIKRQNPPVQEQNLRFVKIGQLFTPAERSFIGVLEQALNGRYRVFGKVRTGDIIAPAKGLTQSEQFTARNRIERNHVDFLICSTTELMPIAVVELDDKTHERKDRTDRDEFIDKAMASAGMPIIHFQVKQGYTINEIREKLAKINQKEKA